MKHIIIICIVGFLLLIAFCVQKCTQGVSAVANIPVKIIKDLMTSKRNEVITINASFSKDVLDITTVKVPIEVDYEYKSTFWESSKTIELEQTFEIGYGIEANPDISVYRDNQNVIHICNLPIKVISCTPVGSVKIQENNGLWNKIGDGDREHAHRQLVEKAKQIAEFNSDAIRRAQQRVVELFNNEGNAYGVKFKLD